MSHKTKKNIMAEAYRGLLNDLRWAANNPNVTGLAPGSVMSAKRDGWEFGCQVKDLGSIMIRKIFVKADDKLDDIPAADKDPVMNIVFDVMLEQGSGEASINVISPYTVLITQEFSPILLDRLETAKTHIRIKDNPLVDMVGRMMH